MVEWIIVDGSESDSDQIVLETLIHETNLAYALPIKYVSTRGCGMAKTIGFLRNLGNVSVSDNIDIVIVQDDDDYMFPTRFRETVRLFKNNPDKDLVGCAAHYMYDCNTESMYQFCKDKFPTNSTPNCCMSYRLAYARKHRYNDADTVGEEAVFLDHFANENNMAQLHPRHNIVQMAYLSGNTFNKQDLIISSVFVQDWLNAQGSVLKLDKTLDTFIQSDVATKYRQVMLDYNSREEVLPVPDIVYYCSPLSIEWSPQGEESLGGSEQAVCHLAREWARLGKTVHVYCKLPDKSVEDIVTEDGVVFRQCSKFQIAGAKYKHLILWRSMGMSLLSHAKSVQAENIWIDFHDCVEAVVWRMVVKYKEYITGVFFKSTFHISLLKTLVCKDDFEQFPLAQCYIVRNGIRIDQFKYAVQDNGVEYARDKYRFVYASSYTRGLVPILKYVWPQIKNAEPRAELHIMYGYDGLSAAMVAEIRDLIGTNRGVMEHGRVSADIVARHKHLAMWHLYPTSTVSEICCISLRESLVAGCIPVTSDVNIFASFPGVKIAWNKDLSEQDMYCSIGKKLTHIFEFQDADLDNIRDEMAKSPLITSWANAAVDWLTVFDSPSTL